MGSLSAIVQVWRRWKLLLSATTLFSLFLASLLLLLPHVYIRTTKLCSCLDCSAPPKKVGVTAGVLRMRIEGGSKLCKWRKILQKQLARKQKPASAQSGWISRNRVWTMPTRHLQTCWRLKSVTQIRTGLGEIGTPIMKSR